MTDLQTLSDHHDIRELIVAYSSAIDARDFDALDAVFTPDAAIDYRAMGGIAGTYADVKAWLRTVLPQFPQYQHMVGNLSITLDGERAVSKTAPPELGEHTEEVLRELGYDADTIRRWRDAGTVSMPAPLGA